MRELIGRLLGLAILSFVANLVGYTVIAWVTYEKDPSLWSEWYRAASVLIAFLALVLRWVFSSEE